MGVFVLKCVCLLQFVIYLECSRAQSLNDTRTLVEDLLAVHQKFVRPVYSQNNTVDVIVHMFFQSIQEFNELEEMFSYVGALAVYWRDVGMAWDPSQYGGVKEVDISCDAVWIPAIVLTNPAKEIKPFAQKWQSVHYQASGLAFWFPGVLLETTCPVNARYYPYDTQVCTTTLSAIGFDVSKIRLNVTSSDVDLSYFPGNSAWSLEKTKITVYVTLGTSQIDFTFYLKRKPEIVIITILLPILFLSILNVLVFVLVPESGERVSLCLTILLSIAVFLTIVSDTLPKSSEPVPIISYKLMVDMILSSLITVVTILNLGLYHTPETETKPNWILSIYSHIYCKKKCEPNQVCPGKTDPVVSIINEDHSSTHKRTSGRDGHEEGHMRNDELILSNRCMFDNIQVTWKELSRMVDHFSICLFSFASVVNFVVFVLIVATD